MPNERLPPEVFTASGPTPRGLILALHGLTENGQKMRDYSQLDGVGDTCNCDVVYPSAIGSNWIERPAVLADRNSAYLNGVMQSESPAAVPGRRFGIGFSDGACKLATDADRLELDRLVIYAGYPMGIRSLNPVGESRPKLRVLVIRGRDDRLVSVAKIKTTIDAFRSAGHDVTFVEANGGHHWDPGMNAVITTFLEAS